MRDMFKLTLPELAELFALAATSLDVRAEHLHAAAIEVAFDDMAKAEKIIAHAKKDIEAAMTFRSAVVTLEHSKGWPAVQEAVPDS